METKKIRPVIKSSHIRSFHILESNLSLILSHQYSPIVNEKNKEGSNYPLIEQYLIQHKDELKNRSRSKDELWSFWRKGDERNTVDFSIPKLVWPYRGTLFRAAIDFNGNYHSQDVILLSLNWQKILKSFPYSLAQSILDNWTTNGVYFYAGIFNSTRFHKILFNSAKEFARDVKDFQPNNFQDIFVPLWDVSNPLHIDIITQSRQLTSLYKNNSPDPILIQESTNKLEESVEKII